MPHISASESEADGQQLVGPSGQTRSVRRLIEKLGRCRWPALVVGETGTGKEVVARAIHGGSKGPFVTIDCAASGGSLMETALFGHVKGAFTGSAMAKTGLIEAANGGTAFFDEIGELPLDLQAKLLRVLQEKEFRPVGSLVTRRSDFRIVAATNRDLPKEAEKGTFRRDLYFRLNVINIRLAPLRERKEDIPALINHFLSRVGGNHRLTARAMDAILAYEWPGNVRELENCIQYMVAVSSEQLLDFMELPLTVQGSCAASSPSGLTKLSPLEESKMRDSLEAPDAIVPLAELEYRAIVNALEHTKGDRAVAAHLLGIGRTTLYRKLREHHLAS